MTAVFITSELTFIHNNWCGEEKHYFQVNSNDMVGGKMQQQQTHSNTQRKNESIKTKKKTQLIANKNKKKTNWGKNPVTKPSLPLPKHNNS